MIILLTGIKIDSCQYKSTVEQGFYLDRPSGVVDYGHIHFHQSMNILYDGKISAIPENSFIFYEKGVHQLYYPIDGVMVENWMHFNHTDFKILLLELGIPMNTPFYLVNHESVNECFRLLAYDFSANDIFCSQLCDLRFNLLLYEIAEGLRHTKESPANESAIKKFRQLRADLSNNPEYNWSLSLMAEKTNYSISHFCSLYKTIFGISAKDDLINKRMEKAKHVLVMSSNSIQDISEQLCYQNATSFTAAFTKKYGISPSEYRKRFR